MVAIRTVGEQMAKYGVLSSPNVTCSRKEQQDTETRLLEKFSHLEGVRIDGYTYKRYGYVLSDAVATNYATEQEAQTVGFQARLVNSGMAAIDTALRVALANAPNPSTAWLYHGGKLYPETLKLIGEYRLLTGCEMTSVDNVGSMEAIRDQLHEELLRADVLFFETVTNHPTMQALPTPDLLRHFWRDGVTLILDNTFPTSMNVDIVKMIRDITDELGEPTCTVVIVESLTKYYRTGEDDPVTAGIIMAPADFIAECDAVISRTGAYLQYSSLVQLPWSGMDALERTVVPSSRNAQVVVEFLRKHALVESVGYPSAEQFPDGAGAVLFFVPKTPASERILHGMGEVLGPMKGLFGHPETTWVPWGERVPGDYPESTIRLSCGWGVSAALTCKLLDKGLEIAASAAV